MMDSAPVDYADQLYVEGIRQLALMIKTQKTEDWAAVAGILRACADNIEHLSKALENTKGEIE